jgi:CheY-like chemotaxis protein
VTEVYKALRLKMHHYNETSFAAPREERDEGLQRSQNLLVVDDCRELLHILGECFAVYADGYNILTAPDGREAIKVLQSAPVDILLTDLHMPGMNGLELSSFTKNYYPGTKIFTMSGDDKIMWKNGLNNLGISAHIRKPFSINDLMSVVLEGHIV